MADTKDPRLVGSEGSNVGKNVPPPKREDRDSKTGEKVQDKKK